MHPFSVRPLAAAGLLAVAVLTTACGAGGPEIAPPPAAVLSLLLVGDTGRAAADDTDGVRLAVGAAMAAEDRRLPASRLVLLGNNFQPEGLLAAELVPRLRENVVRPFCHFLRLDGPRSSEVMEACPLARAARHAVLVHAVLGEDDHRAPDGAALQREGVGDFVPGWHVPRGMVHVEELEPGVSLLMLDSQELFRRPEERMPILVQGLRSARGRFRIVVAHHPPAALDTGADDAEWMARATARVRDALARAGEPVHLWVSGHEQSLQLLAGARHEPSIVAVAGSGSDTRPVRTRRPLIFGDDAPGFARVDLVDAGADHEIVVTLFEVDARSGTARGRAAARIAQNGTVLGTSP